MQFHPSMKYPAISKFLTVRILFITPKERMVKKPLPTGKRRNKYIFGDERENKELLMIQKTQKNRSYSHAGRWYRTTSTREKEENGREWQKDMDPRLPAKGASVLGLLPRACTWAFPVSSELFGAVPSHLAHRFHLQPSKWARKQEKQTSRWFMEKADPEKKLYRRRIKGWTST